MSTSKLIALAAAVREALATPESLTASSPEEREARLDLIDLVPELNATLIGNVAYLHELAWSVSQVNSKPNPISSNKTQSNYVGTVGRTCPPHRSNQPLGPRKSRSPRRRNLIRRPLHQNRNFRTHAKTHNSTRDDKPHILRTRRESDSFPHFAIIG